MNVQVSVVVPVFNEEDNLEELHRRLTAVLGSLGGPYEIVLVDDGSKDRSWTLIEALAARDPQVVGLRFSRNFGQQMALAAGLDWARGEAVVIMDADLQDPPELIPELLARHRQGYEVVYAVRTSRAGESFFKRATAKLFYRLLRRLTQVDIPLDTGDFRLMGRQAVAAFRRLPERHRFTRGLVAWLGFPSTGVPFERPVRQAGEAHYPLRKMVRLALDAITAFSHVPLQLALWLGLAAAGAGVVWALGAVLAHCFAWPWPDNPALVSAVLLLGGAQLVALGLLGEYLGRVFDEVKRRPLYLVQAQVGGSGREAAAPSGTGDPNPRGEPGR